MSLNWMKPWLMLFFVLSGAASFNLFFHQSARDPSIARYRPPQMNDRMLADDPIVPGVARVRAAAPSQHAGEATELIRAIQRELGRRGYETGGSDGMPGLLTRAAIMAFEHDRDMPLTGEPSEPLLQAILFGQPQTASANAHNVPPRGHAERIVKLVQQQLQGLGYPLPRIDGVPAAETERAIRAFEASQRLPVTGRISGQLVARLGRQPAPGRVAEGR